MVLFTIVSTTVTANLQKRYLRAVLHQRIAFHDTELRSGAVAEALGNHASTLRSGLSDKMGMTVQHSATVIAAFAVAISSVWNLALATAAGIPASVLVIGSLSVFGDKFEKQINSLKEEASATAHEVLSSIRTVRSLNATEKMYRKYEKLLKSAATIGWRKSSLFGVVVGTYMFMLYAAYALAFWYGIRLFAQGSVHESGKVITTLFSIMIGMNSFSQLAAYLGQFMGIISAAKELFSIDDSSEVEHRHASGDWQSENTTAPTSQHAMAFQKDIIFSDVTFKYPARPEVPVLKALSLSIPGGKQTAIVGQSGCGKSTLVALLLRWYDAESGSIQVGDVNLSDTSPSQMRANIGFVQQVSHFRPWAVQRLPILINTPQEPRLFSGTVLENVEFGLLGTPMEHLSPKEKKQLAVDASRIANANDFINRLPQVCCLATRV